MKQSIKNIWYLLRSAGFFVFHGSAKIRIKNVNKIVIFQTAKLGDMVCTTPVFRALKVVYPNCQLIVIGNALNKEVVSLNPDIDEYCVFEDNISTILTLLKKRNFDAAILTVPNYTSLVSAYLAGIKTIVAPRITEGPTSLETKPFKLLRNFTIVQNHPTGSYAPREYVRRLEVVNIFSSETKKFLFFTEKANKNANSLLMGKNGKILVGISPAAGNRIKQWPGERFGEVADHLISMYGAEVFILGGQKDIKESNDMKNGMRDKNIVTDLTGALSVDELKAFISKLSLFISVDTGPIYIAEAHDVPTIDITGPIDEREQPPIGEKHRVVYIKNRIAPALHLMNAKVYDKEEARRQTESITVKMVTSEIDDIFTSLKKYPS